MPGPTKRSWSCPRQPPTFTVTRGVSSTARARIRSAKAYNLSFQGTLSMLPEMVVYLDGRMVGLGGMERALEDEEREASALAELDPVRRLLRSFRVQRLT